MKSFLINPKFEVDDIISYTELTAAEKMNLQKGMNFNVNPEYSVFLMSIRKGAPYADKIDEMTNTLIYEGHDVPSNISDKPKEVDQRLTTPSGALTENGKFYIAAQSYKLNLIKYPHRIKVYEKIQNGVWCYKGFYNLIDAKIEYDGNRNVFKFYLQPVEIKSLKREVVIPFSRVIPTQVKVEVWARDKGQCVKCGSKANLHYDHDLPYSKGGTSLTAENVRILCMKCNLSKSNKILSIPPILLP
ncbi:tellurium resistance protein terd [hydrocarbon metagenome]|uniref:Tellurium resistance protein terd n=1 Tax=hydrocarbon metagenome TaxID=938273 RepID=A0A0W8FZD6_9ZZZZ